jgi:hypothetical protein
MNDASQEAPQPQPQSQPPRRPPDIVVPMGQPIPPGPGIEWWIRRIRDGK